MGEWEEQKKLEVPSVEEGEWKARGMEGGEDTYSLQPTISIPIRTAFVVKVEGYVEKNAVSDS